MSDLTIIIPTLDEERNIKGLLNILTNKYPASTIIVTDDGSRDRTQEYVRQYQVILLDRSQSKVHGLTASVIDAAKNAETENIVVIDGDLQHPPEKIQEIEAKLNGADIVIGVRKKVTGPWPLPRKMMSKIATLMADLRLGIKSYDPMSGFFGIKTELFKNIIEKNEKKYQKEGYKVLFDTLKYMPKNTKLDFVGYEFSQRKIGNSKIGAKQVFAYLKSFLGP